MATSMNYNSFHLVPHFEKCSPMLVTIEIYEDEGIYYTTYVCYLEGGHDSRT
jgi:hypothetical protein